MSDNKNIKTRQVVTAHPSSLKHSNSNQALKAGFWAKLMRNWPITLTSILSLCWLATCIYIGQKSETIINDATIIEISTILSGVFLPLILLWLLCIVLIRVNPLEDDQRSLEKGLDQLLGPVEVTQNRVNKIVENLNSEMKKIDEAADVASNRFEKLENIFQEQIANLLNATSDADKKTSDLKNKLATERDAISLLSNEIEKHTDKITAKYDQYKKDATSINESNKKHSETLSNEMSFQHKTFENRAHQIEDRLESLGLRLGKITDDISNQTDHSYENLSEIIDGFDERKAALNNFMTLMMEEVSTICEKLDLQANTMKTLTTKSSKDSKEISKTVKKQSQDLSRIATKAMKDLASSGNAIEVQAKIMEQSISEAAEQSKISIAKASDVFVENANDLNRVSSGLEANIKQNFDEITDTITDKAQSLGEDISIQFQNIEADLDRGNTIIEGILSTNIDGLNSLLKQSHFDTQNLLTDVMATIEVQSENIDKSLSDTRLNMIDRTTLLKDEYQSLEKYADTFQNKMKDTEADIKKQHHNMLACITIIEDGLNVAVDKIKNNSTNLGSHGQKIIETIIAQSNELNGQIEEVQKRSKNSILEIQQASSQANDNILSKDKKTTDVIIQWLDTANEINDKHTSSMRKIETLVTQLISLEKASDKTLSSSDENIRRISNELLRTTDKIHIASNSAIEAVEETNQALGKNSEKYQQMVNAIQLSSQSLAINANAMESKFRKIKSESFSDVAASVMQKLHSRSIDLSQYLEGEIPKDLWDKYIAGDKNLFIRKIKKYIGKKTTTEILAYYKKDSEFRKYVDDFTQIFEELLETFSESTDNIYCETLLSSDIGKVYFALADATGRLK